MGEGIRGIRGDDERESRDFGGGALGLRTGSYGSLQNPVLQQQNCNGVSVSVQSSPVVIRKIQKMSVSGSREKERFLPWISKLVGRKNVGMLVLAIISIVALLTILSAFSKEEVASEGPELYSRSLNSFLSNQKPSISPPNTFSDPLKNKNDFNETLKSERQSPTSKNIFSQGYFPIVNESLYSSRRYCEEIAFSPPPPVNRKHTGPRPCDVCYVPPSHAMIFMPTLPSVSPILKELNYFTESSFNGSIEGSQFSGQPSLQQRNDSYDLKESMSVHCGFYKGNKPGIGSGFDVDEADLHRMEHCRGVVVASAIFGNYDVLQQPKNISELSEKTVCFYMFVDEVTEAYMRNTTTLNSDNRAGIWRVVVVHNLPYADARRNGKIPKLLLHRLFTNARYSVWIDGKLELVVDPYQILERFLWRKNATFAISRHYKRFDVFVEAEANKAAGKYDNSSIDKQIEFYKNEGLTHYSEAKLPITSDVPEGCVIIKEHIPITNLFTCLWFNEVDRFTSRDQISFSTVRDKIMSKVNWSVGMFLDCERRNFVVQAYHKDLLDQKMRSIQLPPVNTKPLPEIVPRALIQFPLRKQTLRKQPRSSRHRHIRAGNYI
ncbi:hypothetical protein ZOSMA_105G00260 [Zostera marina]|uniref:TOD1/MUCI70 glycosyltransferase-like domain-containing protein n=1 Tax=Zostera marina TaxID=29655 RepID=A0A0K9Q4V7_ZOSMR|nr:hypothetical protein ZOSMA_105G00260 [Zostera marina]